MEWGEFMTNYERIKNMSVEELAEFIDGITDEFDRSLGVVYKSINGERVDYDGADCFKLWLESEVEG